MVAVRCPYLGSNAGYLSQANCLKPEVRPSRRLRCRSHESLQLYCFNLGHLRNPGSLAPVQVSNAADDSFTVISDQLEVG
jgi:hypothetical protein